MKSKHTARENDEFLKIRSLQKRDRLNIFVFFYYYYFIITIFGGLFSFFVLHFNKLVNICSLQKCFLWNLLKFIFAIYYVTIFGNGSLTIVFLNLRFNAWFVNFDCISKSLNVE